MSKNQISADEETMNSNDFISVNGTIDPVFKREPGTLLDSFFSSPLCSNAPSFLLLH